jgi:ion channel-forming bestrophin family protein
MILSKENFWFMGLKGSWSAPTWRALFSSLLLVSGYYLLLYWLRHYYVDFEFHIPGFAVYMLGYVIALLFYFRLNNSYYRWNDGYKSITYLRANMDTFTMKVNAYLVGLPEDQKYLGTMMKNFARAMRDIVRNFQDPKNMINAEHGFQEKISHVYHLPSRINSLLEERLNKLYVNGSLTRVQFLDLNRCISRNSEQLSSAEALKGTPPPKTYIIHIRGFLISYMLMIPFGFTEEYSVWMLLFLIAFFFFYSGLEIVSEVVEDPFGFDPDDLPVEPLTTDIENRIDDNIKIKTHA